MCGITGFIDLLRQTTSERLAGDITRMMETIRHRGPDDSGIWTDVDTGVALGFRRLAILDLTPSGHQPMVSANGRYILIFNGEIYNFAELRQELAARRHTFRGRSDTEVMLESFCEWGVEESLKRFNGMFAFALWDRQERKLFLARDRIGIKPLYYGWMGNTFIFGSELKALRAHPDFKENIDRNALALYLRHNHIPAPYSIYLDINKLSPGTYLVIDSDQNRKEVQPLVYWSARHVAEQGAAEPFCGSDQEALSELDTLLRDSIRLRMIADVPLGAFLSGGVDSSCIVALMQSQSSFPVRTFTIGFNETNFNEAVYAKAIARHLGTDHTELYVTPKEALDVIPRLPQLYDEPFADSSQIPTFLVSELTRRHVTVSLSGDGGDELFCGYNRYIWSPRLWNTIGWMPARARQIAARSLAVFTPGRMVSLAQHARPLSNLLTVADKVEKLSEVFASPSPESMYRDFVSLWKNPETIVYDSHEYPTALTDPARQADLPGLIERAMYSDLVSYLPDDILVKVDRASMAVSLEERVPFLDDHRIVEFAWKLPLSMKKRGNTRKWLLRQVLYQYVPKELIERPKMGFSIPVDSWLRGPLREWAEEMLDEKRLQADGFFNPAPIRKKWKEHKAGCNWQHCLWDILVFQSWLHRADHIFQQESSL